MLSFFRAFLRKIYKRNKGLTKPHVVVWMAVNQSHKWRNLLPYTKCGFALLEGQSTLPQMLGTCNLGQQHLKTNSEILQLFGTKMKNNPFKMFFNFTKMHSSVKRSTSKVVFRQMHNKVVAVAWWTNYRAALLVNFGLSWFPGTLSLLVHLLVCLLFPSHSEVLLSPTVLKAIWWTGHSEYDEEEKRKKNCMVTSSFHTQLI